jgi:hypothetical protein
LLALLNKKAKETETLKQSIYINVTSEEKCFRHCRQIKKIKSKIVNLKKIKSKIVN